jgi:anti-sigma regulatory factor (Ser/Thr protein kinase)
MARLASRRIILDSFGGKKEALDFTLALGRDAGFGAKELEELALVASELASNLIHHAKGGELIVTHFKKDGIDGLELETKDTGPGFADLRLAQTDGYSSQGRLGYGLGTVNRLMDDLEITSSRGRPSGSVVIARKYLYPPFQRHLMPLATFGVASMPKTGSKINGDGFLIKSYETGALVAVIDGLGHGQYAHRASRKALDYIENHFRQSLGNIFLGVGRECLSTRGAVMALARFDWQPAKITFASIGNIETKVYAGPTDIKLLVRRGVLGKQAPRPLVVEHEWEPGMGLVMHSDGISTHWKWVDFPDLWRMPAQQAAAHLMRYLVKNHDDATVLVAKGSSL